MTVTLIVGDGISREICASLEKINSAMGCTIKFEKFNCGYEEYIKTGKPIQEELYKSIEKNKIAIKGPTQTIIGAGYPSINVYLRKKYDLFSNIRKIRSLNNTGGKYKDLSLTIFRENTEGLYIGDEEILQNNSSDKIVIAKKKVSRVYSERIIKKAFEYCENNGINKLTVTHKANILKLSDGLFLECARNIGKDFPKIKLEEVIIDNMCMGLVMNPHKYSCIVTMNLYGDILSDLSAGLIGGLGLAPGANIGDDIAIFEPVHGSAPDIAGKNLANPTAILLSYVELLNYTGMHNYADKLNNAIIELYNYGKILTKDLGGSATTEEFCEELISFFD